MHPDEEKRAFLIAIQANRYDQTTRLVFADWLEEHGYDDEAQYQREWTPRKEQAIEYIEKFAEHCSGTYYDYSQPSSYVYEDQIHQLPFTETTRLLTYQDIINAANAWLDAGEYFELNFDTPRIAFADNKFWQEFVIATGRDVPKEKRCQFVNCSC